MTPALPAWDALPAEEIWAAPVADSRSPLSQIVVRADAPMGIDATIAQRFGLVGAAGDGWDAQLGVTAALFLGFQSDGQLIFDFQTFDGWFALPLDVRSGAWSARLEWAHVSAHYGDGVRDDSARPGNFDPWSREYARLHVARELGPARVYASARAVVHATPPVDPFGLGVGAEVHAPWRLSPYAAVDLQVAQESAWAPALSAQAGAGLAVGGHRLRLAVAGRTGPEDTGKLQPGDERWIGLLFGFDAGRSAPVGPDGADGMGGGTQTR